MTDPLLPDGEDKSAYLAMLREFVAGQERVMAAQQARVDQITTNLLDEMEPAKFILLSMLADALQQKPAEMLREMAADNYPVAAIRQLAGLTMLGLHRLSEAQLDRNRMTLTELEE